MSVEKFGGLSLYLRIMIMSYVLSDVGTWWHGIVTSVEDTRSRGHLLCHFWRYGLHKSGERGAIMNFDKQIYLEILVK